MLFLYSHTDNSGKRSRPTLLNTHLWFCSRKTYIFKDIFKSQCHRCHWARNLPISLLNFLIWNPFFFTLPRFLWQIISILLWTICNGTPLQYSCLENPMDGGAWKAAVHGVAEGWTRLSDFTFTFHFHALEKEMETGSMFLPGESQGQGSLVGCRLWGRTESNTTEVT